MKIFLVDDQKISNFINKRLIESCSFEGEVITFEDPEKALGEIKLLRPDFVLLDINMPEIDGWRFLDMMETGLGEDIKVIMVTSSTNPVDKLKAREYPQVIDYFVKPLSKEMVFKLMKMAC